MAALVDLLGHAAAVSGLFSLLVLALILRGIQLIRRRRADADAQRSGDDLEP